jgi:hypothetical protein
VLAFEVDDLQAAVDRLAADGYGLVGDIGQYARVWRMATCVVQRGPSCPWPSESAELSSAAPTPTGGARAGCDGQTFAACRGSGSP